MVLLVSQVLGVSASQTPYTTYTYSYNGDYQISPNAFVPTKTMENIAGGLNKPNDMRYR